MASSGNHVGGVAIGTLSAAPVRVVTRRRTLVPQAIHACGQGLCSLTPATVMHMWKPMGARTQPETSKVLPQVPKVGMTAEPKLQCCSKPSQLASVCSQQ
jgi:hypothetical protein